MFSYLATPIRVINAAEKQKPRPHDVSTRCMKVGDVVTPHNDNVMTN